MNRKQFIQGLGVGIVIPVLCQTYAHTAEVKPTDIKSIVTSLKQGGYVIVFRHGASNKNQVDTALNFSDISIHLINQLLLPTCNLANGLRLLQVSRI